MSPSTCYERLIPLILDPCRPTHVDLLGVGYSVKAAATFPCKSKGGELATPCTGHFCKRISKTLTPLLIS